MIEHNNGEHGITWEDLEDVGFILVVVGIIILTGIGANSLLFPKQIDDSCGLTSFSWKTSFDIEVLPNATDTPLTLQATNKTYKMLQEPIKMRLTRQFNVIKAKLMILTNEISKLHTNTSLT